MMATKKPTLPPRQSRDVNQNVKRIFDEVIERSERKPNRGTLRPVSEKPFGVKLKPERNRGVKLQKPKKAR